MRDGRPIERAYDDAFPVAYGQFYLLPQGCSGIDFDDAFRGQANGLCGTNVREAAVLITGLHTGCVDLSVDILGHEPPREECWEEVVESTLTVGSGGLRLVSWDGSIDRDLRVPEGTFRARYSAAGFGVAEESDGEDTSGFERYRLEIWPAEREPDRVVRVTREAAAYWHGVARASIEGPRRESVAERNGMPGARPLSPRFVYVPLPDSTSVVTVAARSHAAVGEWITLGARRENSPWKRVASADLDPSVRHRSTPPEAVEDEVGGNVTWRVDPPGVAVFGWSSADPESSDASPGRTVRFDEPGEFRIRARSAGPIPSTSNELTLRIVERRP